MYNLKIIQNNNTRIHSYWCNVMCNVSGYPRSDMSRDMSPMSRTCHKCNNLLQYTTTLITCNITSVNYSLWNIERHRDVSIKVIPKKITVHDHCLPSTQLFIAYNSAKWRNKNLLHGSFTFYNTYIHSPYWQL